VISHRLVGLHLVSRQTRLAVAVLAVVAVVLRISQPWTGGPGLSGLFAQVVLMLLTVAAAAVTATMTQSPFGESERIAASPLAVLRLTQLFILTTTAGITFALAAVTGTTAIGTAGILRNLAGFTGIALITAALLGGAHSWTAPLAYTLLCGGAIDEQSSSEWTWPTLPAGDRNAALVAVALLVVGIAAVTFAGPRDRLSDPW
jgi:hypothetical protein